MNKETAHPAYSGNNEFVFICYSHADGSVPGEIRRLQEMGINVWYDTNIIAGSEWTDTLARRIQDCSHFLYFLSKNSADSENCRKELLFAQSEGKNIVVIQLEDVELPPGLRLSLNHRQVIFANLLNEDEYVEKLSQALGGVSQTTQQIYTKPARGDKRSNKNFILIVAACLIFASLGLSFYFAPEWRSRITTEEIDLPAITQPDSDTVRPMERTIEQRATISSQISYSGRVTSARISPDGEFIAYFDSNQDQIRIHDLATSAEVEVLPPENFALGSDLECSVDGWSPDSGQVVAKCRSGDSVTFFNSVRTGGVGREIRFFAYVRRVYWTTEGARESFVWGYGGETENPTPNYSFWIRNHDTQRQTPIVFQGPSLENQFINPVWVTPEREITIVTIDQTDGTSRIYSGNLNDLALALVYESSNRILHAEPYNGAVYFLYEDGDQTVLARLNEATRDSVEPILVGDYSSFSMSENGKIAVIRDITNSNIWAGIKLSNGEYQTRQLTSGTRRHSFPIFSNRGDKLAFNRWQGGTSNIHSIDLEGREERQLTYFQNSFRAKAAWHPSDQALAVVSDQNGVPRIWIMGSEGENIQPVSTSPLSSESLSITWATPRQLLYQTPGNRTHRFVNPYENYEAPLFELHELHDSAIVTDVDNPAIGWNFNPTASPDGSKIALFWNRTPGRGLWLIEKGLNPPAPKQLAGQPGAHVVAQNINMDQYAGKPVRLSVSSRFRPLRIEQGRTVVGFPFAGLRVFPSDVDLGRIGAFTTEEIALTDLRQLRSTVWSDFVIENKIPERGGLLRVFCGLSGEGTMLCDDMKLEVETEPGVWENLGLENGDFEQGVANGLPIGWRTYNRPLGQHQVSVITPRDREGSVLEIQSLPNPNRVQDWRPLRWSNDGTQIYMSDMEGDLWSYTLEDQSFTRLTTIAEDDEDTYHFDISADGNQIAYVKRTGQSDVWAAELPQR